MHGQDYVKWRGLLLYRFLATLVDADSSVKDLGIFTLTRPLINKASVTRFASQHIIQQSIRKTAEKVMKYIEMLGAFSGTMEMRFGALAGDSVVHSSSFQTPLMAPNAFPPQKRLLLPSHVEYTYTSER